MEIKFDGFCFVSQIETVITLGYQYSRYVINYCIPELSGHK